MSCVHKYKSRWRCIDVYKYKVLVFRCDLKWRKIRYKENYSLSINLVQMLNIYIPSINR